MKHSFKPIFLVFFLSVSFISYAQNSSLDKVKLQIEALTLKEQNAFKAGDCETVMSLMADNIVFYANGRNVPSKDMINAFCQRIPRPFKETAVSNLEIHVLNENAGFVVRTLEFDKDDHIKVKEVVTKIWSNTIDGWKMVHLQSTVKEVPKD